MRHIAFIDLERQRDRIRDRLDAAIAAVLDHGQYIMGPEITTLEMRLAEFCGARHAVTCSSGTDALILALLAKSLHRGDAVVVPSFTFCSTAEAVCLLGGIPIFADVDEDTFNLDPASLDAAVLSARRLGLPLRGVISVDLFGQPCDYDALEPRIGEYGLWLICDAAQSFGATYRRRNVGTIGDITTTSFFPAKPLGCFGDGGAVFTDDAAAAEVMRSARVHGQGKNKYDNVRLGINGRMDTLQAAVLLAKLSIFREEIAARNDIAARYHELLPPRFLRPTLLEGASSVWAQYTVRTASRDDWVNQLRARGVPVAVYYPRPLHRQPAYEHFPTAGDRLAATDALSATVLSLPMHPYLTEEDQHCIVAALGAGN